MTTKETTIKEYEAHAGEWKCQMCAEWFDNSVSAVCVGFYEPETSYQERVEEQPLCDRCAIFKILPDRPDLEEIGNIRELLFNYYGRPPYAVRTLTIKPEDVAAQIEDEGGVSFPDKGSFPVCPKCGDAETEVLDRVNWFHCTRCKEDFHVAWGGNCEECGDNNGGSGLVNGLCDACAHPLPLTDDEQNREGDSK